MSRHRFDPSALVGGTLFLAIAVRYLIEGFGGHRVPFAWTLPAVFVTIAAILFLRVVFRSRRPRSYPTGPGRP